MNPTNRPRTAHATSRPRSCPTHVNMLWTEVARISVDKNSLGHPSQTLVDRWDTRAMCSAQKPGQRRHDPEVDHHRHHDLRRNGVYPLPRSITQLMDEDHPESAMCIFG